MATKSRSRTSRYQSQIDSETQLRYGPQLDALASLLQNAQSERNQALSVNASTSQALSDAARLAQPEVKDANADYLAQLMAAQQTLGNPDMAAYAASGDPYKQALARDLAGGQMRAAETTRAASDELTQRGLDARAGARSGGRAITDRYAGQADQIGQQVQSLTGQSGAFASSRLAELLGEDDKRSHETAQARADRQSSEKIAGAKIKSSEDTAAADRASREKIAREKLAAQKGAKVKWATPQQTGALKDSIGQLQSWLKANAGDYSGTPKQQRAQLANDLLNGVEGTTTTDMDPKSPTFGQQTKGPGVPKVKKLVLTAALDLFFDGHLARPTVVELHRRRYKISDLGLPTKPRTTTAPTTTATPGASSTGGLPVGPIGRVSPVG